MKNLIKKYDEKGFTLMEMLIVVAIIAILVAIAFPIFNKQLNSARVATDAANIRTGYASATTLVLDNDKLAKGDMVLQKDGSVAATGANDYKTQGKAGEDNKDVISSLASCGIKSGWTSDKKVTYKYDDTEGKVTTTIEGQSQN